jgi:hypothetical protein
MPVVFPFLHNWEQMIGGGSVPVVERLEFLTDIMPAHKDYEQRVANRPYGPRRIFEYQIPLPDARSRQIFNNVTFTPNQSYYVPVCSDLTLTTGTATDSGVDLAAQYRDFDTDGFAMLWSNPWTYDFVTIEGTTSTSISYTTTLANSWPEGSVIVPMRRAYLEQKVPGRHHASNIETVSCEFHVLAEELSTNRYKTYSRSAHKGFYQFDFAKASVSWVDEKPYTIEYRGANIDFESGVFSQRSQDTGPSKTMRVRVLFDTRADMGEFLDWLRQVRGRQKLTWVPSYQSDLAYVSGTGFSIKVRDDGYLNVWEASPTHREIKAFYTAISGFAAQTTSAKDADTDGSNGVDLTLSATVIGASIEFISFLHLCRLNSDTVELQWQSRGNVLEVILEFKEVQRSERLDSANTILGHPL